MPQDKKTALLAEDRARRTYGPLYDQLCFVDPAGAAEAEARRDALLARLQGRVRWGAAGTKADCATLSPGCQVCLAGGWSCLFINGRCNTRCFYCPDRQDDEAVPVTNTLPFPRAAEYVAYLERFGFSGASISGGEPLLDAERALSFLRAVKGRFGARMHTWLYTNGILLDAAMAERLAEAGLDELRLDIGATAYRLDAVRAAVGRIPCVTVEIPAVPEDLARRPELAEQLAGAGVQHLNLHQLKATPHNLAALAARGYRFVRGEQLTVLGSELSALELLAETLERQIPLPVNYCSWAYKRRYQQAAARRRAAALVQRPHEAVAESGLLRRLSLLGEAPAIAERAGRLSGAPAEAWAVEGGGTRLCFAPELWDAVQPEAWSGTLLVGHTLARIKDRVSYRFPFVELSLGRKRRVAVERLPAAEELTVLPQQRAALRALLLSPEVEAAPLPKPGAEDALARFVALDRLERGLPPYA